MAGSPSTTNTEKNAAGLDLPPYPAAASTTPAANPPTPARESRPPAEFHRPIDDLNASGLLGGPVVLNTEPMVKHLTALKAAEDALKGVSLVIRTVRTLTGVTQAQLAKLVPDVKLSRIQAIETGDQIPTTAEAVALLKWSIEIATKPENPAPEPS